MKKCKHCLRELPEEEFYASLLKRKYYLCRDCCTKSRRIDANFNVGGWKIIYLNYVKKGEYRFQALNTDGRFYQTNDPIEIYSILEDIFGNLCEKNQK